MNLGKAFTYMFKDPDWGVKMIIFSLFLLLLPTLIGVPFVVGYVVLAVKATAEGKDTLPKWTGNWGNIFTAGLKYTVIMILWSVLGQVLLFVPFLGDVLNSLWFWVTLVVSPVLLIKTAISKEFTEIFDLDWYLDFIQKNLVNIILVVILNSVLVAIAGLGILACFVGIFFTVFYSSMGTAYLTGELYRVGSGKGTAKPSSKFGAHRVTEDLSTQIES